MGVVVGKKNNEQLIKEILDVQKNRRRHAVTRVLEIIKNRVDEFGVTEPQIQQQGSNQIVVQLPGVVDTDRAEEVVSRAAYLEFKLVEDNASKIKQAEQDNVPEGYELKYWTYEDEQGKTVTDPILLHEEASITGQYLTNAYVGYGQLGRPEVRLQFDRVGARMFSRITGEHINERLAIILDGKIHSAPVIRSKIPDGNAVITGGFDMEEASTLASILRAGSLPIPVEVLSTTKVGPTLGEDSIKQGVRAAIVGGILVVLFMIAYYRLSGVLANFALFMCLLLVLGTLAGFRATLTLPGIAGLVLTIGMSVDANVLIFERIREELAKKKTVRVAVDSGYHKALHTIADANITTLIAALVLFYFGTGPVKGFAVVLSIGVLASMFTALVFTKLVLDYFTYVRKVDKLSI
jgi:preprotein translocase subunit SecD